MLELREWMRRAGFDARPWLVLGKGPSFGRRSEFDLSGYNRLALNHAVRALRVEIAHIIDVDVVEALGEALTRNATWLLVPRHPHVQFKPGPALEDHLAKSPTLAKMEKEGRLVWYNLSTAAPVGDSPVISARYFSCEAALNLLGTMGVKTIRSLGIDGGTEYAQTFEDLSETTRLANTQPTFDLQFPEIARILLKRGLDYAPLIDEAPIRVYVGTDESQMLAARVLEYSIRKRTSMTVELFPLNEVKAPMPKRPEHQPRTPFSFARFAIPQLAGHRGRAIYLDADMQVFTDLSALWRFPFKGASVLCAADPSNATRRKQFSVLLMDCARLEWDLEAVVAGLDEGRYSYEQLMYEFAVVPADQVQATLPERWNSLETYRPAETALIHYTDMPTQPWVSRANQNARLWVTALKEAIDDRFISIDEVKEAVGRGFARPSLLADLNGWEFWRYAQDLFFHPHHQLQERLNPRRIDRSTGVV